MRFDGILGKCLYDPRPIAENEQPTGHPGRDNDEAANPQEIVFTDYVAHNEQSSRIM